MGLAIPESFHYGDQSFPWDGRVEPFIFRRRKWILSTPVTYGPVPVISVNTGDVSVFVGDDSPSVQVSIPNTSVFYDLCLLGSIGVVASHNTFAVDAGNRRFAVIATAASINTSHEEACNTTALTTSNDSVNVTSISNRRVAVSVG